MEGHNKMSNVLNALNNVIRRITKERIVCPCGHIANSQASALSHLDTHPSTIGRLGMDGVVTW